MKVKQTNEVVQFKHTEPSPVKDVNLEIRYLTPEAIELIYAHLITEMTLLDESVTSYPTAIMNLPLNIRMSDPNLLNSPWYEIKHDKYLIRLAPNLMVVNMSNSYSGWDNFFGEVSVVINALKKYKSSKAIEHLQRVGLRYTSLYQDLNIVEKMNMSLNINGNNILDEVDSITTLNHSFKIDEMGATIQVVNSVIAQINNINYTGSLIDLDTYKELSLNSNTLLSDIISLHDLQKRILGTLLSDEYINECNNKPKP